MFEYKGIKIDKRWVNEVVKGEKAQRDRIQLAILACIAHGIHNSYSFDLLTQLVLGLEENGGRNLRAIMTYISKTCQGIHWVTKENRFKAVKDKTKVVFKELEYPWYQMPQAVKDNKLETYDCLSSLKVLAGKLEAIRAGKAKDKRLSPEQAKEALDALQVVLQA